MSLSRLFYDIWGAGRKTMVEKKKIQALFCGGYILEDGTVVVDDGTVLSAQKYQPETARKAPVPPGEQKDKKKHGD
jgi:predicted acyl esterase